MNAFGLKDEVLAFIIDAAKNCEMSKVILFGSRAKGTFSPKSDGDLAIAGRATRPFKDAIEEKCPTLLSFDFIDLSSDVSVSLRNRIDTEGVVLYEQA